MLKSPASLLVEIEESNYNRLKEESPKKPSNGTNSFRSIVESEPYHETLTQTRIPFLLKSSDSDQLLRYSLLSISEIDKLDQENSNRYIFHVDKKYLSIKTEGVQEGLFLDAPAAVLKPIFSCYYAANFMCSPVFHQNEVSSSNSSFCEYIASNILSAVTDNKTSKVILGLHSDHISEATSKDSIESSEDPTEVVLENTPSLSDLLQHSTKFACSIFFKNYISLEQLASHYIKITEEIKNEKIDQARREELDKEISLIQNINGLEEIVASSIFIGENDIHSDNYGVILSEGILEAVKIDHGESLRVIHTPFTCSDLSLAFCTLNRGLILTESSQNIIQQEKSDGLLPFSARKLLKSISKIMEKINPDNLNPKKKYHDCTLNPDLVRIIETSIQRFIHTNPQMMVMNIPQIASIQGFNTNQRSQLIGLSDNLIDYLNWLLLATQSLKFKDFQQIEYFIKINEALHIQPEIIEILKEIPTKIHLENKSEYINKLIHCYSEKIKEVLKNKLTSSMIDLHMKDKKGFLYNGARYFNNLLSKNTGSLLRIYRFLDCIFNKLGYVEDLYLSDIKSILNKEDNNNRLLSFMIDNRNKKLFNNKNTSENQSLLEIFLDQPQLFFEITNLCELPSFFRESFLGEIQQNTLFKNLIICIFNLHFEKTTEPSCDEERSSIESMDSNEAHQSELQKLFELQNKNFLGLIFLILCEYYSDQNNHHDLDFDPFLTIFRKEFDYFFNNILQNLELNSLEIKILSNLILNSLNNPSINIINQTLYSQYTEGFFDKKIDIIMQTLINDCESFHILTGNNLVIIDNLIASAKKSNSFLNILSNYRTHSFFNLDRLLQQSLINQDIEEIFIDYISCDISDNFQLSLIMKVLKEDRYQTIEDFNDLLKQPKFLKAIILAATLIDHESSIENIVNNIRKISKHHLIEQDINDIIQIKYDVLLPENILVKLENVYQDLKDGLSPSFFDSEHDSAELVINATKMQDSDRNEAEISFIGCAAAHHETGYDSLAKTKELVFSTNWSENRRFSSDDFSSEIDSGLA